MQVDIPLNLRYGAIALFFIGPAIMSVAGLGALSAWHKQSWPAATATVLKCDIEETKKSIGFSLKGRTRFADYFTAQCNYAYEIDGKRFTETDSCAEAFDRAEVERNARPYAVGNRITIYYSPRQPENSVLRNEADIAGLAICFGLGGLAIPVGLVLRQIARNMAPEMYAKSVTPAHVVARMEPLESKTSSWSHPAPPGECAKVGKSGVIKLLLRGTAVCTGLVIALFGGICTAACIYQVVKGTDASGKPHADIAVPIVATIICALFSTCGALLIWVGLKRKRIRPRPADGSARPPQLSTDLGLSHFKPT